MGPGGTSEPYKPWAIGMAPPGGGSDVDLDLSNGGLLRLLDLAGRRAGAGGMA